MTNIIIVAVFTTLIILLNNDTKALKERVTQLETVIVAKCGDDVKVSIYDEGTGKLTCIHKNDSYADSNRYIDERWAKRMQQQKKKE